jgi:two-component system sensor histidine kinase HydH
MRGRRLGRMLGRDEAPAVPPPPGHREIQHEELSRLFGRMAGARLVALPPIFGIALWFMWHEPARWRKLLLVAAVSVLTAFFVAEWVRWRRRGFTAGAVPRNLSVAIGGVALIAFATGGLASPFLYVSVPLGVVSGVFVPWPTNVVLALVQIAAAWGFALLGATGAIPDFNLAVFGGGARTPVPAAWLWSHATMLSFVYAFAGAAGRAVRWSFDRMVQRTAAAQEESLRAHAERAEELTALSGEIAHELKNPLASVKGLAGLLAQHLPDGKGAERLGVLRREVDRMQSIVDEFLNFSRPLVPLALGHTDVGALCRDVAALHEGMARERAVEIAVRADFVRVRCDPRKTKQVLINLLQNALDASPAGSAVELVAERGPDGGARVRVLDRGRGVDPALAGAVFAPGVTTKAAGSGLGLTIARALARQHGGEVALVARPGGGTAAEVILPAGEAEPGPSSRWTAVERPGTGEGGAA